MTILFLLIFKFAEGQKISIVNDRHLIRPSLNSLSIQSKEQVKLTLKLSGAKPAQDIILQPVLEMPRPSAIGLKLTMDRIILNGNQWPADGMEITVEIPVNIEYKSVDSFGFDEIIYLSLKQPDDSNYTVEKDGNIEIRVTTIGAYDRNKSFWIEVGSNFDLVDGLQPNNFFSGVFFYKRDIEKIKSNSGSNRLGVFAGVFESKTLTDQVEEPLALRTYYDTTSVIPDQEFLKVYKAIGSRIKRITVRNVGLFFSPQFRITGRSANQDGLHVFVSGWAELQWQRVNEELDFENISILRTDTLPINDVLGNDQYFNKTVKRETDIRSHYFGAGLPIFFKETVNGNIVHLFINTVAGITSQPTEQYLRAKSVYDLNPLKYELPIRKWSPFYVIQFRLNEENYGIAFTGEVRGLLKKDNRPYVSLALSKKFDLTKFIEFNKR